MAGVRDMDMAPPLSKMLRSPSLWSTSAGMRTLGLILRYQSSCDRHRCQTAIQNREWLALCISLIALAGNGSYLLNIFADCDSVDVIRHICRKITQVSEDEPNENRNLVCNKRVKAHMISFFSTTHAHTQKLHTQLFQHHRWLRASSSIS